MQLRPIVDLTSPLSAEVIVRQVGRSLRKPGCSVSGLAAPNRIELHVHGDRQHFWSPQLIVDLMPQGQGTALKGHFGPHPSVWTMYMAGYAICTFALLVSGSFAYAQWVMEQQPWALWGFPLSLLSILALYAAAWLGQRAGAEQMHELLAFLKQDLAYHESLMPSAREA